MGVSKLKSHFNSWPINSEVHSPCKDCDKRTLNCHSLCEEYQTFVKKKQEANEMLRNNNYRDNYSLEWRRGSLLERINRKNGK